MTPQQDTPSSGQGLSDFERRLIAATQAGLPLTPRPYQTIAAQLGCTEAQVMREMEVMLARGLIRRIGAVPNHYRLGYVANGMTVWDVADEQIDALGTRIGRLPFVSHCYQRPRRLPVWPYNLFAMVHGRSAEDIERDRQAIRDLLGDACSADEMLVSSRILKKTGLRLGGT